VSQRSTDKGAFHSSVRVQLSVYAPGEGRDFTARDYNARLQLVSPRQFPPLPAVLFSAQGILSMSPYNSLDWPGVVDVESGALKTWNCFMYFSGGGGPKCGFYFGRFNAQWKIQSRAGVLSCHVMVKLHLSRSIHEQRRCTLDDICDQ
jgi:hypothetical protein